MVRTKLFFTTDVHGSDRVFRKFINAAKFYGASVLILGGDITGKVLVPIVKKGDSEYECDYFGAKKIAKSAEEVESLTKSLRDSGYYAYTTTASEAEEAKNSPKLVHELFLQLMKESIARWVSLAEERLKGTGVRCYVSPGNDDLFEIDDVLNSSSLVVNPEERVVNIDDEHEMITLGYANHTPWNSPREVDEDILAAKIEAMAAKLSNPSKSIFNLHVPPIGTPIDKAPKLDAEFRPILSGGTILMTDAGSTAVRSAIEKYRPLVGMHGHIHEAKGYVKVGRTMCFNPGSEYSSGVLRGLVLEVEGESIRSHLLTSG